MMLKRDFFTDKLLSSRNINIKRNPGYHMEGF